MRYIFYQIFSILILLAATLNFWCIIMMDNRFKKIEFIKKMLHLKQKACQWNIPTYFLNWRCLKILCIHLWVWEVVWLTDWLGQKLAHCLSLLTDVKEITTILYYVRRLYELYSKLFYIRVWKWHHVEMFFYAVITIQQHLFYGQIHASSNHLKSNLKK